MVFKYFNYSRINFNYSRIIPGALHCAAILERRKIYLVNVP